MKNRLNWPLIILLGLTLTRGLIYLSLFPPWVAPDEPAHFEAIRIIGQEQQIPYYRYYESTPVNPDLSQSFQTFRMWELLERPTPTQLLASGSVTNINFINYPYPGSLVFADSYPILPHLLFSPISNFVSDYDIATELYILRLISVLLAIPVTILAWMITKRLFPTQPQFWIAIPSFIVFLPMHTHIFASVNSDVLAILLTSTLLFVLISGFDTGFTIWKVVLIGILTFLALLTKRTVVFTVLWVGLTAILYLGYRRQWPIKRMMILGLGIIAIIGLALGLVIIKPDILSNTIITLFNINLASRPPIYFTDQTLTLVDIIELYIKSGLFAFITFWGNFGGATTNIPWPWAYALMILCAIILAGATIYLYRAFRKSDVDGVSVYQRYIFIVFIIGVILSLANSFLPVLIAGPKWGPAARYFFPVIIPIATFFFLGFWQLFPAKYRHSYGLPVWLAGLVLYDALVIADVLIPFLYG